MVLIPVPNWDFLGLFDKIFVFEWPPVHSKCSTNVSFCYDDDGTFIHSTSIGVINDETFTTWGGTTKQKEIFACMEFMQAPGSVCE